MFLNDYAAAIVSTIHQHSGDLLKMIDDGLLAICPAEDRAHACAAALDAVQEARASLETLNERAGRTACQRPTCISGSIYLGVVFHGKIGGKERLDFPVVANEVARIATQCRSVDQPILMSSRLRPVAEDRRHFTSVGRFSLCGVGDPQQPYAGYAGYPRAGVPGSGRFGRVGVGVAGRPPSPGTWSP